MVDPKSDWHSFANAWFLCKYTFIYDTCQHISKNNWENSLDNQQQNIIILLLSTLSLTTVPTKVSISTLYKKKRMPLSVTLMNHFYQQNVFAAIHLSVE